MLPASLLVIPLTTATKRATRSCIQRQPGKYFAMDQRNEYFTYRLSSLPKSLQISTLGVAGRITGSSLAPCPISPGLFNIATVTFHGVPSFAKELKNGEAIVSSPVGQYRVDDTFFGVTPLNHAEEAQVEYGCHPPQHQGLSAFIRGGRILVA